MADASSLRNILRRVDGTAPLIQGAAGAMMKHYDRSASVAVNEWRNSLQTAETHQLLPLLYVANEVLQNSKRNRGNAFLEAMSPILTQALTHICQRDANLVEKVRRTVKIWGDRHVFSIRFVNDLLLSLEPYRNGGRSRGDPRTTPTTTEVANDGASFSPDAVDGEGEEASGKGQIANQDDDILEILRETEKAKEENADDGDEDDEDGEAILADDNDEMDELGDSSQGQKLQIEINMDSALASNQEAVDSGTLKRRKSTTSVGSQTSQGNSKKRQRRKTILSANNMLELWKQLTDLQERFDRAQHVLDRIDQRHGSQPASELEELVGDELLQANRQNDNDLINMMVERRNLHGIAQERRALEREATRYLKWLEKSLKQDEDDIQLCDVLEQKITTFQYVHGEMKKARDEMREEERERRQREEERERLRKEAEEAERFRRAALAKETEAKPGMVWNPTTREYQVLNTDESWRD